MDNHLQTKPKSITKSHNSPKFWIKTKHITVNFSIHLAPAAQLSTIQCILAYFSVWAMYCEVFPLSPTTETDKKGSAILQPQMNY